MIKITGTVTTFHKYPECISEALKADNLLSMTTETGENCVICTINGDKLRSIIASVDDYLMNLSVAEEICSYVSH
ncbi:MAG: hypothetical protein JXQ82_04535 [Methanomicrobiaceae archaeon]|nr:hypothetical protein [Methanomicrobiaceae archaeon]